MDRSSWYSLVETHQLANQADKKTLVTSSNSNTTYIAAAAISVGAVYTSYWCICSRKYPELITDDIINFLLILFYLILHLTNQSIKDVPTTLHAFTFDDGDKSYNAINISNGAMLVNNDLPIDLNKVLIIGVVPPLSANDDFLTVGGKMVNIAGFNPILWSYNVQIASYDYTNNIAYLNIQTETGPSSFSVDKVMDLPLSDIGLYLQSSYNQSSGTCYLSGTVLPKHQKTNGQMLVASFDTQSGEMSSDTIKFDVPDDSCTYFATMYQYDSNFYAALYRLDGQCPSYIFQVDIVANTSTLLVTIPYDGSSPFSNYMNFVLDSVNGYLSLFTNFEAKNMVRVNLFNLNTYELTQYAVPRTISTFTSDLLLSLS
ncbi:hypothetical protein DFA_11436 [Cavenderia fasciculata]|uniref:Uncharacterized protein n=1 Tax=Cavenderia fasciculata TaxID=261658 RepID=F4QCZ4_CACFS|nr:uncharacterized protein DFA_11436 [Cavenderia fasciculata]EGG13675.1 hypothetical protein DFA_11436 [Cavenderia fasciculata]|eukprot:XP_004350379.1 hypothetical protein DFA_11436 [Cavenderia fasciculata]